jgi:hypothetical protein
MPGTRREIKTPVAAPTCRVCGQPFARVRDVQVFCSPRCRRQHCRRLDEQPRLPLGVEYDLLAQRFEEDL